MYQGKYEFSMMARGAIHFGCGVSDKTGELMKDLGCTKAVLIADKGVTGAGITDKIATSLKNAGVDYVIYDDVITDAPLEIIEAAADFGRDNKVDGIVGVGGGSVLDTAKAVSALLSNEGTLTDFLKQAPKNKKYPLALISTTSGTGSEVTSSAIIHDPSDNRKKPLWSPAGTSDLSISDPLLTLGCPKSVTLYCGMDVLLHSFGMYTNHRIPEYADPLLEDNFKRVADYLPLAVEDGSNLEARIQMSYASMIAGMLMKDVKCHMDHMLGQEAAPMSKLPHGLLVALALPVTAKYVTRAFPQRVRTLLKALGFICPDNLTQEELGIKAADDIRLWLKRMGIGRFSEFYKMTPEDLAQFKKGCQISKCWGNNPFEYDDKDLDDMIAEYTA